MGLAFDGTVVAGDRRGRVLGFPTANVEPEGAVELPADGVYAGSVVLADGASHVAAISVGRRPTYYHDQEAVRLVEAYLLDFDGDLYGQRVRVRIGEAVRGQQRFDSDEELIARVREDVDAVRALEAAGTSD